MKRFCIVVLACALSAAAIAALTPALARAQDLDLGGAPGAAPTPVNITADGGITWSQDAQTVTASGNAMAVRGNVTVTADQLVAHYQKASGAAPPATASGAQSPLEQGGGQLTELDAIGHVHIFTATDNAWGDHAVYSVTGKVLVLTGAHLKLTTPQDVITARDSVEYYALQRKAVARGNALIVADDGRSIAADVITGYLAATSETQAAAAAGTQAAAAAGTQAAAAAGGAVPAASSLQKVEAVGHVIIRTSSDTVTGDAGVYLPPTGQARIGGHVHIIHGANELAGADALVNMKTGVATLLAGPGGQVTGVILPNSGGGTP